MKNTSAPLTTCDTCKVTTNYRYIVATRMLYRDYCGVKKVENQQLYTIQSQDRQIIALKKANDFLSKKDSVNSQIILKDSILNLDLGRKLDDANFNLAKNKRAKIGMAIAVPVAAILSFVFGWYLHVR